MIHHTKIVGDTGAQRSDHLQSTYGCALVPLILVIDGEEHRDDELDSAAFYARVAGGATVTTAAPSPGEVLARYQDAADEGAAAILSIHLNGELSGMYNSARLAADSSPIPVELLDTGTVGYGVDLCIEAAARALQGGASPADARAAAQLVSERTVNVFVVGQPAMFERGGRSHIVGHPISSTTVLATGKGMIDLGTVDTVDAMVSTMVRHVVECADGRPIRVGVGHADSSTIAAQLAGEIRSSVAIDDMVEYALGLSLAAHLGPGTVAATFSTAD